MEMKNIRRLLALCLAVVMIIASSMAVMAADNKSPGGGDVDPDPVIVSRSSAVNGWNGKTTIKYTGKNAVNTGESIIDNVSMEYRLDKR